MTITASGKVLTLLVVFKGAPNGSIVKRESPTLPKTILYACQDNAWMDAFVMEKTKSIVSLFMGSTICRVPCFGADEL